MNHPSSVNFHNNSLTSSSKLILRGVLRAKHITLLGLKAYQINFYENRNLILIIKEKIGHFDYFGP